MMGTRHLIIAVSKKNEVKIAQYGQWDGYPEGQGVDVLNFLKKVDLEKFNEKIEKLEFFTEAELEIPNLHEKCPWLSRDMGANILSAVYEGKYQTYDYQDQQTYEISFKNPIDCLINSIDFAGDGLWCEWAYVIDLHKNTFEVYEGFNQGSFDTSERFYKYYNPSEEHTPVKLRRSYALDNLPSKKQFLNENS